MTCVQNGQTVLDKKILLTSADEESLKIAFKAARIISNYSIDIENNMIICSAYKNLRQLLNFRIISEFV
ncbi:hypothetical protein BHC53_07005 [Snodgrassella alvi]|nr:hypothetical protein BHC53_07005 [Snodgrassella alvi]